MFALDVTPTLLDLWESLLGTLGHMREVRNLQRFIRDDLLALLPRQELPPPGPLPLRRTATRRECRTAKSPGRI